MAMLESMVLRGLVAEEAKLPLELLQGYIFFTIHYEIIFKMYQKPKQTKIQEKKYFKIF